METQHSEKAVCGMGENNANHLSDKRLISKVYKKHTQLHSTRKNNQIRLWSKNLNTHLSKKKKKHADGPT